MQNKATPIWLISHPGAKSLSFSFPVSLSENWASQTPTAGRSICHSTLGMLGQKAVPDLLRGPVPLPRRLDAEDAPGSGE